MVSPDPALRYFIHNIVRDSHLRSRASIAEPVPALHRSGSVSFTAGVVLRSKTAATTSNNFDGLVGFHFNDSADLGAGSSVQALLVCSACATGQFKT